MRASRDMKRFLPWIVSIGCVVVSASVVLFVLREKDELREHKAELIRNVNSFCETLASTLGHAAAWYSKRLEPLLRSDLTPDQLHIAETAFDSGAIGVGDGTSSGRATASHSLHTQFSFCAGLRGGPMTDDIRDEFIEANAVFRTTLDRQRIAQAIADMGRATDKLLRLPLRLKAPPPIVLEQGTKVPY